MTNKMRLLQLATFLLLTACGASDSESQLNVVNGQTTTAYPATVLIRSAAGTCSGTFVGSNTLITARHCVSEYVKATDSFRPQSISYNGHKSKKIIGVGTWHRHGPKDMDVSLVIFSGAVAPAIMSVSSKRPSTGDELVLVGYGSTDGMKSVGVGTKRIGRNKILYAPDESINIRIENGSLTGGGDSGGAGFINNELVGVISSGNNNTSSLENITHESVQNFFAEAVRQGAKIKGFSISSAGSVSTPPTVTGSQSRYKFGAKVTPAKVTTHLGQSFDGMKIMAIVPDSPAAKFGFQVGDTITLIDRKWVKSSAQWDRVVEVLKSPEVLMHFVRSDHVQTKTVELSN